MNRILKWNFHRKFADLPIYQKFLLIISLLTLTLLCTAFTAIEISSRSNEDLLYSSVSSLMSNSSNEISDQITDAVSLTQSMLADTDLQSTLSELKDSHAGTDMLSPYTNLYQDLSTLVYNYYYSYPSRNISYIAVTNGTFTLSTYNKGNQLTRAVINEITSRAEQAGGSPVLITDYAEEYGIFIGRTVRRIDSLQLDSLGTIIVNLDIASMLKDATSSISLSEDATYVLAEDNIKHPFYSSGNLPLDNIQFPQNRDYCICSLSGTDFFAVRGDITGYNWKYLCLIQYNSILASRSTTKILCIIMTLCAAFIIFSVVRRIIYSLTQHLNLLAGKMIAFGKDDSVLPGSPYDYTTRKDEIGTLHNQFDIMAKKIQTLINENYKNELLRKDMLLKNLENQINPHFLYNTLESINWRAKASGETQISQMVEALGSLLRTSLSPHPDVSTLASEMKIVRNYITIQKIRYEDRLFYEEDLIEAVMEYEVPMLTLQPLIENSVRYGLEANIGTCCIQIKAFIEKGTLIVQIINDGSQFEENTMEKLIDQQIIPHGFGIGILNIQRRIQMIYGNDYGINLKNIDEDHALSEITLPARKAK